MISQRSHIRDEPVPAVEEEWQIISTKWWRTSFGSVSWSYEPEKASRNVIFAKPPHYHFSLYKEQAHRSFDDYGDVDEPLHTPNDCHLTSTRRIAEDDALNEELIGVKNVRDVLRIYEQAVGFDYSPWPDLSLENPGKGEKLPGGVSEVDVQSRKKQWGELVDDLLGGISLKNLLIEARENPRSAKQVSQKLFAVPNNSDYFSQPSTPKPFQLNPSASSFVPIGSPTSTFSSSSCSSSSFDSDHLVSFSFPSLDPSVPPTPNKPERQEYVNSPDTRCRTTSSSDGSSVAGSERPSSGFLPPFLFDPTNQRRRPTRISRTRAIVDQLRSQYQQDGERTSPVSQNSSPTMSDFGVGSLAYLKSRLTVSDGSSACSTTPPLTEEDFQHHDGTGIVGWTDNAEGWTIPPVSSAVDPETKRTRSKELLMTLRRRTDSLTSNANAVASLAAARSLSASTPPTLIGSERLVESPEPVEDASTTGAEEVDWFERSNQSYQTVSSRVSSPAFQRRAAGVPPATTGTPGAEYAYPTPHGHAAQGTAARAQTPTYSQAYSKATNGARYPQGYLANTASGLPYPLVGYPLPVPGVSMGMGAPVPMRMPSMPATVAMGTPRVGMQFPVQVPVQTVQYSTLMHLRIMQQMHVMRNSMNMAPVGANTVTGATR